MSEFSAADQSYMELALKLAATAARQGEVPVGAVLVSAGQIIGQGSNSPLASNDATAHAEMTAIRQACREVANYRLTDSTLYVTLEPCAMCAGAIVHSRITRVVCATHEPRAGAAGSVLNVLDNPQLNHRCEVQFGLLREASATLLKSFFKARR